MFHRRYIGPRLPPHRWGGIGGQDGFRLANAAAVAKDGTPVASRRRDRLTDPTGFLRYLRDGTRLDDTDLRTDGTWIWPDALVRQVQQYRILVEKDLREWIVERNFSCPPVARPDVRRALAAARKLRKR